MRTVMFCGHNESRFDETVRKWLHDTVEQTICCGAECFYCGGYGGFDRLAEETVRRCQHVHAHIRLVLVTAYADRTVDKSRYDEIVYPPLESVPPRCAIVRRNEWMVQTADAVIAYVWHSGGGAARTLRMAQRRHKTIYRYVPAASAERG